MINIPGMNSTLTEEEAIKLIAECQEELKKGRAVEELIHLYKEQYSMPEVFLILMHAKMKNNIDPKFHNFTGKVRNF